MSTISEPSFSSDGRKIQISFVLTMPVELELELSTLPSINSHLDEKKNSLTQLNNNASTDYNHKESEVEILKDVQSISNELIAKGLNNNEFITIVEQIKSQHNLASFSEKIKYLTEVFNINSSVSKVDTAIENTQTKSPDYNWGFLR